ncbi:hypothetical protein [Zavarzinella formosa]|uniref:hypothetical protein n=1 Tax=Zavarzinella formosa TaxID=360055 RepID=UPI000318D3AD|nr:hypothetical protein [Zavarzinella formosa]
MTTVTMTESRGERAVETLRRSGNPFRNYFARNPDDDVCARYHVPELYASERDLLLNIIDLYRYDPTTHSEVVPVLGNKGAGKTHLLHSIKHGGEGAWQLLVTPGVYQKDADFLEYLLFQIIDTLLGGGKQRGIRPLDYVGEHVVRRLLGNALHGLTNDQKADLFPAPGLGRWTRKLGLGMNQAIERCQWLVDHIGGHGQLGRGPMPVMQALTEAGVPVAKALELIDGYVEKTEPHNAAGLMRREMYKGFTRAFLQKDEASLADFLTHEFVEMPFQVRPSRQDLVLSLFKVLMEVFRALKTPVVVAFDQLEDLLLARRSDDAHKVAESFFAGIVQMMHQIDGLCFLIFAERGLWNRFVPSLDGYIQDRLNNPVHVPKHGTIKAIRLEAPAPELVRKVVESRLGGSLSELREAESYDSLYPFTDEQVRRIALTEPTLRDMLQQCRHLFDHLVYGNEQPAVASAPITLPAQLTQQAPAEETVEVQVVNRLPVETPRPTVDQVIVKSVEIIHAEPTPASASVLTPMSVAELWSQELRAAMRKLTPEGSITGATREIQAGLGSFLQTCHEHGVKVGPWRLQHVVPEYAFGEHPTYGVMSIAHWACKDSQPWKVGVGLFLAKSAGKPKDLEIKLSSMNVEPPVIDHLILMRTEDDLTLTGKSKTVWADAEKKGKHARLEPASAESLAMLYCFPRWIAAMKESLPEGQPLPNLADLIQEHCEKLLEQVCMPVQ